MLNAIRPKRKAVFTTFYSFKGGVGRTMALLNTACILAGRGRRVLMIDFDLEAPGLTNLALKNIAINSGEASNGLVELITDFLNDPEHSPLNDEQNRTPFFDTYVRQLEIPASLKQMDTGYLHLLPCGRIDATYTDRLYSIDFKQLYAEGVGQPLFKYLKTFLRDSDKYDYVLIDSRTGFSDEGGICTRDLADHIFVVMGLNRQNVDGTVQFLRRLEASGWKEGRLIFVASPVPAGEEALRKERVEAARKAIEQTRFKADFNLRIPYHPRLALDEEPFLFNWSETDLFPAYNRITREMRGLANDTPQSLSQDISEALSGRRFNDALLVLHQLIAEERDAGLSLLTTITSTLAEDQLNLPKDVVPFFELSLQLSENAEQHRRYGTYLTEFGEYRQAIHHLTIASQLFSKQQEHIQSAHTSSELGRAYFQGGFYNHSLINYQIARKTFEMIDSIENVAITDINKGMTYVAIGDYKQASACILPALQRLRQNRIDALLPDALLRYGVLLLCRGEYAFALRSSQEAMDLLHQMLLTQTNHVHQFRGDIFLDQEQYQAAVKEYKQFAYTNQSLPALAQQANVQVVLKFAEFQQGKKKSIRSLQSALNTLQNFSVLPRIAFGHVLCACALADINSRKALDY